MWVVVLGLLLAGCGPVLLGEESPRDAALGGPRPGGDAQVDAAGRAASGRADAGPPVGVAVRIRPIDCGRCFELAAQGTGGSPPYELQWEDGSRAGMRSVCLDDMELALAVVAVDATGARSAPQSVALDADAEAGCPVEQEQTDASDGALCLQNPSLEGMASLPFGQQSPFDVPGWSACINPAAANTPDVGNDSDAVTSGVPPPTDGTTYVALGEGEQISQSPCVELAPGAPRHLTLDLARVNIDGLPQTEEVFLEIWGGLAVDCSARELLWASPALGTGWQTFCVTLQPASFTTQLTLRAGADQTSLGPAYLLVDNLQPVAGCP